MHNGWEKVADAKIWPQFVQNCSENDRDVDNWMASNCLTEYLKTLVRRWHLASRPDAGNQFIDRMLNMETRYEYINMHKKKKDKQEREQRNRREWTNGREK